MKSLGLGLFLVSFALAASPALAASIPNTGLPLASATPYEGHSATPNPIRGIGPIPHNRFMAPNGRSEIHDDGWQTDAFRWSGPLGHSPQTFSNYQPPGRDCGSIAMDSRGRVISICVATTGPELFMFDPNTLATMATFSLPARTPEEVKLYPNFFQDYTSGGYFYLDNENRVVTATTRQHIYVIAESAGGAGFQLVHDYDLSHVLTANELITSALPDSRGLLWFVARQDGVVGTLNFRTGAHHLFRLGHGTVGEIENSFATDKHRGVYIATNRKLYKFTARRDGRPRIVWQVTYPNSGEHKPGQVDDGTGTTPTVMPGGYVNIADNADPIDLVVYRTARRPTRMVRRHGRRRRVRARRMVCKVPAFTRGASADENSLIAVGRSMIAENNYGYTGPTSTANGSLTGPGFERVDLNRNGRGCHVVWRNSTEAAPTVVSKLSIANGLIYTYTKEPGPEEPWYWTTLDFRTGQVVYRQLSGTGFYHNNNYSGILLGPNGTEYLGALGGIMALRDG